MKTLGRLLVVLGLMFSVSDAFADPRIKIGVSTALTGNAATYGIDLKNALVFANQKLANGAYELIFEDDKCSGNDAVSVAHKFVDILKLKYVAGFACSSTALSTAKLYKAAGTTVMVMSASAAAISRLGVFRTWPSDDGAAKTLFDYIAGSHRRLGILSEQTDFAQGFYSSMQTANRENKVELFNENYLTDTSDFRTVLLKLKAKNIDSLFINSQSESTFLSALKQVKQLGMNVQIFSAFWAGSAAFLKNAQGLGDGTIYVDAPVLADSATTEGLKLFDEFQKQFGAVSSVDFMFLTVFEGFRALHQAIQSGQDIQAYLSSTRFHGLFGDWSFDSNGDILGLHFAIKVVRNNKPEKLL